LNAPDRGNDALRKAKYPGRVPAHLTVRSAIGLRRDFRVAYASRNRFTLIDDMVPLI
jgi:hypothetical protein